MTRKRKPIGGLESQPSPKRTMKDPQVPALRSPAQARTRLAEWPLIVDQTPDDQATQVEMAPPAGQQGPSEFAFLDKAPGPVRPVGTRCSSGPVRSGWAACWEL